MRLQRGPPVVWRPIFKIDLQMRGGSIPAAQAAAPRAAAAVSARCTTVPPTSTPSDRLVQRCNWPHGHVQHGD